MRLVLDTNTALSGLLWGGPPGRLLDAAQAGEIELATSVRLLAELEGVLARAKFSVPLARRNLNAPSLVTGYAALAQLVHAASIAPVVVHDPPDDWVLATALSARADLIVSGDADLLAIRDYAGMRIVPASEAVRLIIAAAAGG